MTQTRRSIIAGLAASIPAMSGARAADQTGMAKVPGGKVWWMKAGGGGKTPILTLHGGPGAAHNYLLPLRELAKDRPVIFYDQLGCGKAESPADEKLYTIQRSVDELDALRKALGLKEIILYGHSWGSMLAIEYMCQGRGAGVKQLIVGGALASVPQAVAGQQRLIDAMPGAARMRALEKAGQTTGKEYEALVQTFYDRHVCRAKPMPPDAAASLEICGKSIAYRVMNGPNEFTITGVMKDWERRKDLGSIRVPTYITTGAFDEITMDCHLTIQRGIKGAKLQVFPGCSHMTMSEQPAAYNAALRKNLLA